MRKSPVFGKAVLLKRRSNSENRIKSNKKSISLVVGKRIESPSISEKAKILIPIPFRKLSDGQSQRSNRSKLGYSLLVNRNKSMVDMKHTASMLTIASPSIPTQAHLDSLNIRRSV